VDGRLRVAYQPIVDLLDHRTVALEALIRLDDPESSDLANPPAIIDVAESTGLIGALGTHVLTTSCAQLAQWRRVDAPDLQMHVNVSALELRDPGYLDVVNRILRVCQLPANGLVLEITETAALERQGTSQRNLLALSSLGIEIALDDFGTGFASLDLLAATPTRKLKLDRSFIASVGADDDAVRGRGVIVQAAIGMGRSLGLDIVGEGIETEEQARTLLAWGCQYGQGFLFSRAVPPEELDLAIDTAPRASALARTIDSGRLLSTEAADLARALSTVLAAADPDGGKVRHLAASAARVIAGTVGDGPKHIETSVLLAGIADAPERLAEFVHDTASCSMAAREVLHLLRIPPVIGRRTPPGAIARTAWALANARHAGDASYDPVLLAAHPDPVVDATLRQRMDRWWQDLIEVDRARPHEVLDERFRGRDDAATRLRAFIGLARAISSTGTVDEMLDLAAEEARRVLGAASLSISRWEHERGILRTLINVGDLAEWEERYPSDEIYDLAEFSDVAEQLHSGEMMIESLTGPAISSHQRDLLERLGRGSGASAPIVIEQTVWGELYVTSAIGEPPFTPADGPYLSAVAGFVGIAISRAEDVGRLARMIHEDPLTRIANRRRIEEHVNQQLADPARDTPLALLMIDVEGLKHINDEFGHTAGDELLVRVADTLQRAVVGEPHAVAGRLGGDEFCLAIVGDGEHARRVMERIQERLSGSAAPQPRLSVGIAVNHGQVESFRDLLERADTAQYAAKRRGLRMVLDREVDALLRNRGADSALVHRGPRDAARQQLVGISEAWADQLEVRFASTRDHLVALGELAVTLLDLNRWTLSVVPPGTTELRIDGLHLRRARPLGPAPVPVTEEIYDLRDFPATVGAFETGELAIDVDDADADPAERAILTEHGLRYVIGVPRTDPDGTRWLLELYGDDQSLSLRSGKPLVAALRDATFEREGGATTT
jgi:diguanylate cyclase (GGDEF)-like protein